MTMIGFVIFMSLQIYKRTVQKIKQMIMKLLVECVTNIPVDDKTKENYKNIKKNMRCLLFQNEIKWCVRPSFHKI